MTCCTAGLFSEQRAAIDFLVFAQSRSFVGLGRSSFSIYLPQYKVLQGNPATPFALVGGVSEQAEIYSKFAAVDTLNVTK